MARSLGQSIDALAAEIEMFKLCGAGVAEVLKIIIIISYICCRFQIIITTYGNRCAVASNRVWHRVRCVWCWRRWAAHHSTYSWLVVPRTTPKATLVALPLRYLFSPLICLLFFSACSPFVCMCVVSIFCRLYFVLISNYYL